MASVIIKPIITEKATGQTDKLNKYGFVVDKEATKDQIKSAIENEYGVSVEAVNTMRYGGGKAKMRYTTRGVAYERKKVWKKAIITVAEGDVIDFYSCLLYTSPSPRDGATSRMPSSA